MNKPDGYVDLILPDGYYKTTYPDGEEWIQYIKDNKNNVGDSIDRETIYFGAVFSRVYILECSQEEYDVLMEMRSKLK